MFDSIFEALFKNQGPEMVASITDVIKGREMGIYESSMNEVPRSVQGMTEDETERVRGIARVSDALVNPDYVSMTPEAQQVHEADAYHAKVVQKMATGYGPDDINLREPDMPINVRAFEEDEFRAQVAHMTDARNRLDREHTRIADDGPIVEAYELLAEEPAENIANVHDTPEINAIREKLQAIYGDKPTDVKNDQFGLAA